MFASSFLKRTGLLVLLLLIALGAIVTTPNGAEAAYTSCRGDPIVFLSNGAQVQMTALVSTDAQYVLRVVYTVHAPKGTSVVGIIYTGGVLAGKEEIDFHADQSWNAYAVDTIVHTSLKRIPVTATTMIANASRSASGYSEQVLSVSFNQAIQGLTPSRSNRVQ